MSLLFDVVYAAYCPSTHHKIALDALEHLRDVNAHDWQDLFLKYYQAYLDGAKAPDTVFKDFKNHVLHVGENYWGGAPEAAVAWYQRCVASLRAADWGQACFDAGVLSHYYADPLQPFHTGQTEAEGAVHRPCEWSITKSYETLRRMLVEELGGYPQIEPPDGPDWLTQMVRQGAEASHPYYQVLLDHYDLDLGMRQPPAGLDQELKICLAKLLGHAVVGLARILDRAFAESAARPPAVSLVLESVLATLKLPVAMVANKLGDVKERALLQDIYTEVLHTGKAVYTLPEDDWSVRKQHAEEVLHVPLENLNEQPAEPTGLHHGQRLPSPPPPARSPQRPAAQSQPAPQEIRRELPPRPVPQPEAEPPDDVESPAVAEPPRAPPEPQPRPVRPAPKIEPPVPPPAPVAAAKPPPEPPADEDESDALRFYLETTSPIVEAPSIGPKTADRLQGAGIATVHDLLRADARSLAAKLAQRWITAEVVQQWQAQAEMACRVPGLRGHDVQILVACGITDPLELATAQPQPLLKRIDPVVRSKEGERILRSAKPPDLAEVTHWIACAEHARDLR